MNACHNPLYPSDLFQGHLCCKFSVHCCHPNSLWRIRKKRKWQKSSWGKVVVLSIRTGTEGAERKCYVNVAIQSEYGKVQEYGKTTLLESLKVCVHAAGCSRWMHWHWSIARLEPDGAVKADSVNDPFVVTAFHTLMWNLFPISFLLHHLVSKPTLVNWNSKARIGCLINFEIFQECFLICKVEVLNTLKPHGRAQCLIKWL